MRQIITMIVAGAVALAPPSRRDAHLPAESSTSAAPKVLVFVDMDGSSGVNDPHQVLYPDPRYFASRKFITSDVNAVIKGLKDGGAGEIVVTDAHGSGNTEAPDVLVEQMDKRATFLFRDTEYDPYIDAPDASYQAIVCVGMHARAQTSGFMAHTVTLEPFYKVNGRPITESAIIAMSAARYRIPVIMIAGDDVLKGQIKEEFPLAEYAVVKRAKGRAHAELIPQPDVREAIATAVATALKKLGSFTPYQVAPAYRFEVSYQNKRQADLAGAIPSTERIDSLTLGYTTTGFSEGYQRSLRMNDMARMDAMRFLVQAVRAHPAGKQIMSSYLDLMVTNWLEPEKLPKTTPPPTPKGKRKYWGDT